MAHALQQLMDLRQTAPSARLVGSPSHREVPSAVARAGEGQAQKRARLPAFPVPLGVTLGTAAERHQAGFGWLYHARKLRPTLYQRLREAVRIGLGLETHDDIIHRAHQ